MDIDTVLVMRHILRRYPRYALFGAGKRGQELLSLIQDYRLTPPVCVMDDSPNITELFGVPVRASATIDKKEINAVLLGTDFYQAKMRARVAELFGNDMKILDLLVPATVPDKPRFQPLQSVDVLHKLNKPEVKKKLKIHFLFQSPSLWPSWESFWKACVADSAIEPKIIVCPPIDIEQLRQRFDCGPEIEFLRKLGVKAIPFDEYDLENDRPHAMVLQTPYDGAHRPKWLRSDALKAKGVRVVYISYGLEFDRQRESGAHLDQIHYMLNVHCNAWRIFTCSKQIKKGYAALCPVGSGHVKVLGHPKFDGLRDLSKFHLPARTVKKAAGRKIIVWQLHFPVNAMAGGVPGFHTLPLERNMKILDYLQRQEDFFLLLTCHPRFREVSIQRGADPKMTAVLVDAFLERAANGANSARFEGQDYRPALAAGNAFLSEISSLLIEMIATQKPVLSLQDVPVLFTEFGESVVSAYRSGSGVADVRAFVEELRRGEDPLAEARREALKNIEGFDGKAGERIKDHIVEALRGES